MLFVIAKDDRRLRIATAKTLEGAMPDLLAHHTLHQAVPPALHQGGYAGGLGVGVDKILARIRGENLPLPSVAQQPDSSGDLAWPDSLIFLAFAVPTFAAVLRGIFGDKLGTPLAVLGARGLAHALTTVFWIAVGIVLSGIVGLC